MTIITGKNVIKICKKKHKEHNDFLFVICKYICMCNYISKTICEYNFFFGIKRIAIDLRFLVYI